MRSRSVLLLVVVGLLVAGMVAAPAAPAAVETGTGVFLSAAGPVERATGPHALRERFVTIESSRLSSQAGGDGAVVFNLFDGAVVEATMERIDVRGPDDFTWIGEVGGLGYAVVTVIDGVAAGRIVDAAEARRLGIGRHLCRTAAEIDATLQGLLDDVLKMEPRALAAAKRLVLACAREDDRAVLDDASESLVGLLRRAEAAEGIKAFKAKALPGWARSSPSKRRAEET